MDNDKNNCENNVPCNEDFFRCCNSSYPATVSAIAYVLAQNYDSDCLSLLAVLFTQLGDTLATIITLESINKKCGEELQAEEAGDELAEKIIKLEELKKFNDDIPIFF